MAKVHELLAAGPTLSFEFWPPRNRESFAATLATLVPLAPDFVSVTYGAAGSTRDRTEELVIQLLGKDSLVPVAHLCCAAQRRADLVDMLARYRAEGIENVLALRGDPPLGHEGALPDGDLRFAAELVDLVRNVGDFSVGVAVHPEGHPDSRGDLEADLDHAAAKLGDADYAITQFFFRVEDYLRVVDGLEARGVDKPVVPGIMPIDRFAQVDRMAAMAGTRLPAELVTRLEAARDDAGEVARIGIEVATELAQKLQAEDVPGLHFYTMNRAASVSAVCANLGLVPGAAPST